LLALKTRFPFRNIVSRGAWIVKEGGDEEENRAPRLTSEEEEKEEEEVRSPLSFSSSSHRSLDMLSLASWCTS
jgi:hypothetical protein